MKSLFVLADALLQEKLKTWQAETVNAVWHAIENNPADQKRIFARCDHAYSHLEKYRYRTWKMPEGDRYLFPTDLFADLVRSR